MALTYKDLNDIVELSLACHSESVYKDFEPDPEGLREWLKSTAENEIIVEREGTAIVGIIIPMLNWCNFIKCKVAREYVWYVSQNIKNRKEVWMKLLDSYEKWAKDNGADLISIGSYLPTLTKVYEKKGFEKNCETLFKRIS